MKFINKGGPVKIRIGDFDEDFRWNTIKRNEIVDLSFEQGTREGFIPVTTKGHIGNKTVETKQIEVPEKQDDSHSVPEKSVQTAQNYFKELISINGVGKKTAQDIILIYPTREKLIDAIVTKKELPFRDDVYYKLVDGLV